MVKKTQNPSPTQTNQDEIAELTAMLQRTRADFENFRKRTEEQKIFAMQVAEEKTVLKLLPMLDSFFLAIKSHPEELAPLAKTLAKTLAELNLAVIDTTNGTAFNPELHEAIAMEEGSGEKEVICETIRQGYLYNNNVIRPAMVKITTA